MLRVSRKTQVYFITNIMVWYYIPISKYLLLRQTMSFIGLTYLNLAKKLAEEISLLIRQFCFYIVKPTLHMRFASAGVLCEVWVKARKVECTNVLIFLIQKYMWKREAVKVWNQVKYMYMGACRTFNVVHYLS